MAFDARHIEPPQQTENRSPFTLDMLTCAECPGTILQKPFFENNEALGRHYVLGHKAFALKELYGKEFPVCPFPAMCQDHHEWKRCGKKLADWEHMVLHFGITHWRLFYLMVRDRYNNYYNVIRRLFPYEWHNYYKVLGKDWGETPNRKWSHWGCNQGGQEWASE